MRCPTSNVFLFYRLEPGGYPYLLLMHLNTLQAALNQQPLKIKTRCYDTQIHRTAGVMLSVCPPSYCPQQVGLLLSRYRIYPLYPAGVKVKGSPSVASSKGDL